MRAIVTVIGEDRIGIIAGVSAVLAERKVNILDIRQTVMDTYFTMIMLVELDAMNVAYDELSAALDAEGRRLGLSIRIQREEIFKSMHQI